MARSMKTSTLWLCCLLVIFSCPSGFAMDKKRLSSGHEMPVVGFGTSTITKPGEVDTAITSALENGYRHIDTAFVYDNEAEIGKSLKKWMDKGGKRRELFVTSKLPAYGNRPSEVENFLKISLERLGLSYLDMYLIHMPFAFEQAKGKFDSAEKPDGSLVLDVSSNPSDIWKEMEKQVKAGRVKSIGVSNFNESQLLSLWNNAEIKPSNLQVETHAYMQQKPLRKFCDEHNIVFTGYAPLGSQGSRASIRPETLKDFPSLFDNAVVKKIAGDHKKTPAQVLLRHANQGGIVVIPKSSNPQRIKSNIDIFDFTLTKDEMKQLDDLDHGDKGRVYNFLFWKGVEKHPQYPFTNEIK